GDVRHLQGHATAQMRVLRQIHAAHAAPPEPAEDAIVAEQFGQRGAVHGDWAWKLERGRLRGPSPCDPRGVLQPPAGLCQENPAVVPPLLVGIYGGDSSSSSVTEPGRAVAGLDRWTEYQRKSRSGTLCL